MANEVIQTYIDAKEFTESMQVHDARILKEQREKILNLLNRQKFLFQFNIGNKLSEYHNIVLYSNIEEIFAQLEKESI